MAIPAHSGGTEPGLQTVWHFVLPRRHEALPMGSFMLLSQILYLHSLGGTTNTEM